MFNSVNLKFTHTLMMDIHVVAVFGALLITAFCDQMIEHCKSSPKKITNLVHKFKCIVASSDLLNYLIQLFINWFQNVFQLGVNLCIKLIDY